MLYHHILSINDLKLSISYVIVYEAIFLFVSAILTLRSRSS